MNKLPKVGESTFVGWKRVSFLRIDVTQGYIVPFWFGMAYYDASGMSAVCYPLILNWIVWLCRETYYIIKYTPQKGYGTWYEGYKQAQRDIMKNE